MRRTRVRSTGGLAETKGCGRLALLLFSGTTEGIGGTRLIALPTTADERNDC